MGGRGPTSVTLVAPGVVPSFGPRVNSQTLPENSVVNPVGPAAAWAWASVGKFSIRQKSDPGGSSLSLFSTDGLIIPTGGCWATDDAGSKLAAIHKSNATKV